MTMETVINIDAFDFNFQSALVFTIFEGLRPGESFKVYSSLYPEPIKEQFVGAKVRNFGWEAHQLEDGGWQTKIAKTSTTGKY